LQEKQISDLECMLPRNCFVSPISYQNIFATEARKEKKKGCWMICFSLFSVPPWQKRFTPKGDLTTVYIANQYQIFKSCKHTRG